MPRPSGRAPDEIRPVSRELGFARHAEGSALIRVDGTEGLRTASIEKRVPPFLRGKGQGGVTAEYGMRLAKASTAQLLDSQKHALENIA